MRRMTQVPSVEQDGGDHQVEDMPAGEQLDMDERSGSADLNGLSHAKAPQDLPRTR
jgi:hypothetical protein